MPSTHRILIIARDWLPISCNQSYKFRLVQTLHLYRSNSNDTMASRSPLTLFFLCCVLSYWTRALQVTPNSPCASICMDSTTLDPSDPNSSNTGNADITCQDKDYGSSASGIKWQNCMSCLQNSTFSQGSENDQMWFLCMAMHPHFRERSILYLHLA